MGLLSGPDKLADELFLIAHDDITGKPRLQPRALGMGLGTAVLTELIVKRHVIIQQGGYVVVINRNAPQDALAHKVLDQIEAEPQSRPIRTWLIFLALQTIEDVGTRLVRGRYVTRSTSLLRRTPWWVPADMNVGFAPLARLHTGLNSGMPLAPYDVMLAGLAIAVGLESYVLEGVETEAVEYLNKAIAELLVPLPELVRETSAAVGAALTSHRI